MHLRENKNNRDRDQRFFFLGGGDNTNKQKQKFLLKYLACEEFLLWPNLFILKQLQARPDTSVEGHSRGQNTSVKACQVNKYFESRNGVRQNKQKRLYLKDWGGGGSNFPKERKTPY